ncbi:hypothetical protein WN48_08003 [Eufriesea mexicana]|nr:hypothetical protein WN48_08003 [Eufriesea mexicana]
MSLQNRKQKAVFDESEEDSEIENALNKNTISRNHVRKLQRKVLNSSESSESDSYVETRGYHVMVWCNGNGLIQAAVDFRTFLKIQLFKPLWSDDPSEGTLCVEQATGLPSLRGHQTLAIRLQCCSDQKEVVAKNAGSVGLGPTANFARFAAEIAEKAAYFEVVAAVLVDRVTSFANNYVEKFERFALRGTEPYH